MLFAVSFGIPLGFFAAKRYGSCFDHVSLFASLLGISIPVFFLAIMLKYVFAVQARLAADRRPRSTSSSTPSTRRLLHPRRDHHGQLGGALGRDQAPDPAGDRARLDPARDHRADHARVRARRAERGLRPHGAGEGLAAAHRRPAARPAQRDAADRRRSSACRPGLLLSGAVLTETVFAWPGIGTWLVDAICDRDYPVLQGGILFLAFVFVLVNLVVDVSYGFLNPRIRLLSMTRRRDRGQPQARAATRRPSGGLWRDAWSPACAATRPRSSASSLVGIVRLHRDLRAADRAVGPARPGLSPLGGSCCPGPSLDHWFGVDPLGRDEFSRIVYGARYSLLIGVVSVDGRPLDRPRPRRRSPATSAARSTA